ncbi:MAG: hypothetical protein LBC18_13035 [Opitutaceae bacterium]|jgi:hypothetical protein|nr:hypothetical protein [Opitutaceae bacterium]
MKKQTNKLNHEGREGHEERKMKLEKQQPSGLPSFAPFASFAVIKTEPLF